MTGALRVGVVRPFAVCANDAGASASKKISDSTGEVRGNEVSGNMNEVRGKGLTERFIRELMVLNTVIVLGKEYLGIIKAGLLEHKQRKGAACYSSAKGKGALVLSYNGTFLELSFCVSYIAGCL